LKIREERKYKTKENKPLLGNKNQEENQLTMVANDK